MTWGTRGRAQHSIEAVLGTCFGEPVLPCLMDLRVLMDLICFEIDWNWTELIWYDLMIFADTWSWEFSGYLGFDCICHTALSILNCPVKAVSQTMSEAFRVRSLVRIAIEKTLKQENPIKSANIPCVIIISNHIQWFLYKRNFSIKWFSLQILSSAYILYRMVWPGLFYRMPTNIDALYKMLVHRSKKVKW